MTDHDYDDDYDQPDGPDCGCADPDPVHDEPWVPVTCGNCGGLM